MIKAISLEYCRPGEAASTSGWHFNVIGMILSYFHCMYSNVNGDKLKGKSSMFLPLVVIVFKGNRLIMRCDKLSARPYRIR